MINGVVDTASEESNSYGSMSDDSSHSNDCVDVDLDLSHWLSLGRSHQEASFLVEFQQDLEETTRLMNLLIDYKKGIIGYDQIYEDDQRVEGDEPRLFINIGLWPEDFSGEVLIDGDDMVLCPAWQRFDSALKDFPLIIYVELPS